MLSFFDFEVELQRDNGPLWLKLKGKDGVKPLSARVRDR